MKTFEKVLKITAIVCSVVLVIGILGTIIGVNKVFNGDYNSVDFNKGEPTTNTYQQGKVKELEINQDVGSLTIKENTVSDDIKVYSTHKDDTKMELIDGKLIIEMKNNRFKIGFFNLEKFIGINDSKRNITVELPKKYNLESVIAEVKYGRVDITASSFRNLNVTAKVGEMKLAPSEYILLDNLEVTNKMGDTEIENLDAINSKISNSMGQTSIFINNKLNNKINKMEITNNMGDVKALLNNIDRDIDISCNMGNVDLISKNHLSKDVSVNLDASIGDTQNNFIYNDGKLNKTVKVQVNVDMGSARLTH